MIRRTALCKHCGSEKTVRYKADAEAGKSLYLCLSCNKPFEVKLVTASLRTETSSDLAP
jgi:transposase-like protein